MKRNGDAGKMEGFSWRIMGRKFGMICPLPRFLCAYNNNGKILGFVGMSWEWTMGNFAPKRIF